MITDKTTPTPVRSKITINITGIDTAAATLAVGPAETVCMHAGNIQRLLKLLRFVHIYICTE